MAGSGAHTTTVLIVDDEDVLRQALATGLTPHYTVLQAADGCEALEVLVHHQVDVILTDLRMPRLGGLKLSRLVRQRWPDLKVVLWSRKPLDANDFQGQVEAVLVKPFTLEQVCEVIEQVLPGPDDREHPRRGEIP